MISTFLVFEVALGSLPVGCTMLSGCHFCTIGATMSFLIQIEFCLLLLPNSICTIFSAVGSLPEMEFFFRRLQTVQMSPLIFFFQHS